MRKTLISIGKKDFHSLHCSVDKQRLTVQDATFYLNPNFPSIESKENFARKQSFFVCVCLIKRNERNKSVGDVAAYEIILFTTVIIFSQENREK